jgi:hypothetical protein
MLDSIRHFKTPYGTMGDLFDVTPIERVSKVYFEDMLFETWNHGRTVLIGDGTYFSFCQVFTLLSMCPRCLSLVDLTRPYLRSAPILISHL